MTDMENVYHHLKSKDYRGALKHSLEIHHAYASGFYLSNYYLGYLYEKHSGPIQHFFSIIDALNSTLPLVRDTWDCQEFICLNPTMKKHSITSKKHINSTLPYETGGLHDNTNLLTPKGGK